MRKVSPAERGDERVPEKVGDVSSVKPACGKKPVKGPKLSSTPVIEAVMAGALVSSKKERLEEALPRLPARSPTRAVMV